MGARPARHWLSLPLRKTQWGLAPRGTCSPCPGGEDHLKRRSSSPPVPPLLGCRRCSRESLSCHFGGEPRISAAGTYMASFVSAASGLMPGCRGRSPRRNKVKISPFPLGRGAGGWGKENKLKAGLTGGKEGKPPCGCRISRGDRRQRRQAPLLVPGRQGQQATNRASPPPPGTWTAATVSAASGLTPGCRGRSPRRNKVKISPFPPGRGSGGWGKESKLKAGLTGGKEGTPPCGCRIGRVDRRQRRQAPAGDMGGRVSRQPSPCAPPLGTENGSGTPATPGISLSSRSAPGNAPEGG